MQDIENNRPENEESAAGAKAKKKFQARTAFVIGVIFAALIFAVSLVMVVISAVKSNERMSLGLESSEYNIIKMAIGDDGLRVAGTQDGEVFAFGDDGEIRWEAGVVNDKAVYDLVLSNGRVYVVFADGSIYSFSEKDAEEYDAEEGDGFSSLCTVFKTPYSFGGNVTNTQLLASEADGGLYLRGVFNDGSNRYYIYRFSDGGEAESVKKASGSFRIGGMALDGNVLYYAYRDGVYAYDGGTDSLIASLDETVVALSVTETEIALVTQENTFACIDKETHEIVYRATLKTALDFNYVFSSGENFLAKIKNGGVVMIGTEEREATLTMSASDSCNFILWNDDCFMLRDTGDIENPVVVFYSVSLAASISLYSELLKIFIGVAVVSALAVAALAPGIGNSSRRRMKKVVKGFFTELWRKKSIYLALVIPFVLLITFYYVPIVLGAALSFLDYIPGERSVFVGFENFVAVLTDSTFWNATGSMMIFLVADLLKALVPPLIVAELILAVRNKRFSLWTRILLFIPGILPGVATSLVWSQGIFGATQNSLVNSFISLFVPDFVKNWINSASYATRMCSIIAFGFPWIGSYLIFYGALGGINQAIFEAAKLDGCSRLRRILSIDIPLIVPQIKYIFITSFIASVQNYSTLYILYGASSGSLIKTPALLMYGEIMNGNYGVASVMGLLLFAFLGIVMVLNFRSQKEQVA